MMKSSSKRFLMLALCAAFVVSLATEGGTCEDPTWSAITTSGAPAGRYAHNAFWTGDKMLVWGGDESGSGSTGTGALYNPTLDSWTAITNTNAPSSERGGNVTVWTGSKMLVWGGNGTNTGAIYDPATDSWSAMSTTNAPAARNTYTYSVVWAGSKMIVWGGELSSGGVTNTGSMYDPATNTWTALSTTNAPTARRDYTAVWTGSKMIVWGGWYPWSTASGGAAYDPATDTWTAISTTSAPSGRFAHSAIWTGSKMIVWGGTDMSSYLNTGGMYDPATDTWSATTTTNAPSARESFYQSHSAVWTGDKMLIWGGRVTNDYEDQHYNTGSAYDPATNTWSAITTTDAPSARSYHSAVWTGSKMLIWGGYDPDYLNTGGIINGY
ncbi:hypothetical protein GEOBC_00375 [Geobacteraceae bacterium]|nr:hypothetical protein GEOBC_00375 [Geobacteraceae bacterium]